MIILHGGNKNISQSCTLIIYTVGTSNEILRSPYDQLITEASS